jgi:HlyD family secretion protein
MNDNTKTPTSDIARKLALDAKPSRIAGPRPWLIALALVVVAGLGYAWLKPAGNAGKPAFQAEAAKRGDLTVTVSASGTLAPTNEVEVGSELSGIIERVNVDVNDHVAKGQVLARLDISKLQDAVVKSEANLTAAEAQVQQAQATVVEARASLGRLRQVAELSGGKVPSKTEMDSAEAALQRAVAGESSARASVAQVRATLKSDRTNLAKASILSPIDGVVLDRKVEPGQTVAASLSAPVLFKLAEIGRASCRERVS